MNWQHYWKAIWGFLALVATNVAAELTTDGQPWPNSGGDWARWAATITAGTFLVYIKANAPAPE